MAKDLPTLSIVVAAVNAAGTLEPWIAAIAPQVRGVEVEVLLVCAEPDRAPCERHARPFVQTVVVPAGALVPAMWSAGMQRARGAILAITITPCIPAADWIEAILASHAAPHAGIGGVIDHPAKGTLTDRALHLVRYTPYLPPQPAGAVVEVAGDNGSYKRAALADFMPAIARDGFWEAAINRQLRARGDTLWLDPRIRVAHARSYSAGAFSRQRFVHGRVFGRGRRTALSPGARLARSALGPVVPALMLVRNLRAVARRGRLDGRTLAATPLALWFFACWAAGETAGLLGG